MGMYNNAENSGIINVYEQMLGNLPLKSYRAGEIVLAVGAQTGQLLVLKKGAVAIVKDGIELARVDKKGVIFGEISALLNQPHVADVLALSDAEFHIAEAKALKRDPNALLYVAKVLARRLVIADEAVVELKGKFQDSQLPHGLKKMLDDFEAIVRVGGSDFGQWM